MGRSDVILFNEYINSIPRKRFKKSAFLGFPSSNAFTRAIESQEKHFYDLSLGNWNINDEEWNISEKYDLLVCTRCPYFAKNPKAFVEKCHNIMSQEGVLLLDWGYGDHWRYENFKIGWVKDGEQESAYKIDNMLWSGVWSESFETDEMFYKFSKRVKKFGYNNVKKAIHEETPEVIDMSYFLNFFSLEYKLLALWEDQPQLYIIISGVKN